MEDFSGGLHLWHAKLEYELEDPDPDKRTDAIDAAMFLAYAGHDFARIALLKHINRLLEDPKADLTSSLRTFQRHFNEGRVRPHPDDRSEVVRTMLRDVGIVAMVDTATDRWSLPMLYSSRRQHSAAWFVAVVMTRHGRIKRQQRGDGGSGELSERQVRRIYQNRGQLTRRLVKFLTGAEPTI